MIRAICLLFVAIGAWAPGAGAQPGPTSAPATATPEAQLRTRSDEFHRAFNSHDLERTFAFCDSESFEFQIDEDVLDFQRSRRALALRFTDFPNLRFVPGGTKTVIEGDTGRVEMDGGIATGPPDSPTKGAEQFAIQVTERWQRIGSTWLLVHLKLTVP